MAKGGRAQRRTPTVVLAGFRCGPLSATRRDPACYAPSERRPAPAAALRSGLFDDGEELGLDPGPVQDDHAVAS